jgi:glucokinase
MAKMVTGTLSERAILGFLAHSPGATVQRLAQQLELSGSTVANVCTRLLEKQLVVRAPAVAAPAPVRGRPAVSYRLALPGLVGVVRLDGSQLTGALFGGDGVARQSDEANLVRIDRLPDALEVIHEFVARLVSRQGCQVKDLAYVVVAANALRTRRGTLSSSVLPWLSDKLPSALRQRLGVPVAVVAAALQTAELQHVHDSSVQTMVRLHVADGVSSHAVIHGRLATGHNDLAGELGHVTLDPHGPMCGCGKRGCIEAMVSGPAIQAMVWQRLREDSPRTRLDPAIIQSGSPRVALDEIYRQWAAGDRFTRQVMTQVLDRLAWALSLILNLQDPDLVRVDGYVLRDRTLWLEELQARVRHLVLRGDSRQLVIENARASITDQLRMAAYQAMVEASDVAFD